MMCNQTGLQKYENDYKQMCQYFKYMNNQAKSYMYVAKDDKKKDWSFSYILLKNYF